MAQQICPYLVTVDQNFNQGPPIEYPSFENRCSASGEKDSLLFPHQATFCLSNGHRMCPLFKAVRNSTGKNRVEQGSLEWQPVRTQRQAEQGAVAADQQREALPFETATTSFIEAGSFVNGETPFGIESAISESEWLDNRRRWGWIGAGVVFVTVLLFGGLTAAWAGWNFANAQLETSPGEVSLADPIVTATSVPSAPYVVWTATSPAGAVPTATPAQQSAENFNFPVAVTATPTAVALEPPPEAQNSEQSPALVVQPPEQQAILVPPGEESLPDIQAVIPTRRDTPTIDISIDLTQVALVAATPTETPTPFGTPLVIFGPDVESLLPGECTKVRWTVKNVQEVYYENQGVNGSDEREECINQKDGLYTLRVVLPSGESQIYTTTITLEEPTPTPTPTWTFTPEPVFTPTWTPIPPTPTETPNIRRGVSLAVQSGSEHSCAINSSCSIGLLVSNTGDQIDNLTVNKVSGDGWTPLLCRSDGVCGNQLPLISVGPGNTVFIELRVGVPGDATSGQQQNYQFVAVSDGSGSTVASESVTINIVAQ